MSSRSFRRRNSRRRRRRGAEGGLPPAGGAPDAAGAGAPDGPGGRPQGRSQGSRSPDGPSQGGRPQGGRPQARPQGSRGTGGRQPSRSPSGRRPPEGVPDTPAQPAVPIVLPDCPVCGKQVRELASALTHRASGKPAHFDCVVRELRESNEIAPQEKICYLGGGSFGILEFRASGGAARFVIKKRIQYEEKEAPQEWKKPLQYPC